MTALTLQQIARALGGEVVGTQVLAPAPGHGPKDRGLCVKLSPSAPDGFLVHLFNGGDPIAAKDYVRQKLGIEPFKPNSKTKPARTTSYDYFDAAGQVRYRKERYSVATGQRHSPSRPIHQRDTSTKTPTFFTAPSGLRTSAKGSRFGLWKAKRKLIGCGSLAR